MVEKMKAAVWHGVKDVRVEEVDVPEVSGNHVLVAVRWAGICGSDLHEYQEGPVFIPVDAPDGLTGGHAPLTMGHEFSGEVVALGDDVTRDLAVGQQVVVNPTITHGDKPDNIDVYDGYSFIGLSRDGGFTKYVEVPEENIYTVPGSLPLKHAALIEPTAVAVQAVKESGLTFGQTAVIYGAGPIGVLTAAAAKAAGATKIVVVDLSQVRLNKALEMGATDVINAGSVDAVTAVHDILPEGADVAFEVAGVQKTFEQAIDSTRPRGTMVIVSIFAHAISFDPMQLINAGIHITSTIAYSRETFQQTVDLVASGQLNVAPVITKEIELDDIVTDGFESLSSDKSQAKILVDLDR